MRALLAFGSASLFSFLFYTFCIVSTTSHLEGVQALNGTINYYRIDSTVLGFERDIEVYLPKDYNASDATHYPVLYFLHGFLGNHTFFGYIHEVIDDMIYSNQSVTPMIIVKPNGAIQGSNVGSLWANSELNGRFEDYFLDEVVPWAETTFKIYNDSRRRMIMGHSFGASAAMRFVFQRRDLFGSVSCHSGFVKMDEWLVSYYVNTSVKNEFQNGVITPTGPERIFTLFVFTASKAWSPNATQQYSVDLPMYNNGSAILRDEIVAKWEAFSPHKILADNLAAIKGNPPHILYFDIGSRDELLLLQPNLDFAGLLLSYNVEYLIRIYDGPHNDPIQLRQRFRQSIGAFNDFLATIPVENNSTSTSSSSETQDEVNRESEESEAFPYGLVIGVIAGVLAAAIIAIVITYMIVTSKFHILFLEKKLTADDDEE